MAIKILLFGSCADLVRRSEIEMEVKEKQTLGSLLNHSPVFAPLWEKLEPFRAAVNCEIKNYDAEVRDGDEIAIFPPFSGG